MFLFLTWKSKERGGGGGEADRAGDCRGFSRAESRGGDLTFWQWAAWRKCRRPLPGGVLSQEEEEGTRLEELEAANFSGARALVLPSLVIFLPNRMFMDRAAVFLLLSPNKSMRR